MSDAGFQVIWSTLGTSVNSTLIPILMLLLSFLIEEKVLQCAFSPVWPQADPWAQHHSVIRLICVNDNTVLTRFVTVHIIRLSLASVHYQFTLFCECECVWEWEWMNVWEWFLEFKIWKILYVFKRLSLMNSTNSNVAIITAFRFLKSLNWRVNWAASWAAVAKSWWCPDILLKVLVGGSCSSSDTVTFSSVVN